MKKIIVTLMLVIAAVTLGACQYESETIVIGEGDWQSNQFYNQVAKYIMEEGYGYEVDVKLVDTPLLIQSLTDGSIHVNVETWSDNMPTYADDIAAGNYVEVGVNFSDNYQGIYVPKYLSDEHGITEINDLVDNKALFPDPEITNWDPDVHKAVVYGGPSGWNVTTFFATKFENEELYPGLAEHFEFRPLESSALLDASLMDAYESEEGWAGYNWEPTTIMGLLDMVRLEDTIPYDADTGAGNMPTNNVTVVVTGDFEDDYPELADFLSKYNTSAAVASAALAYMAENDMSAAETAEWWLKENVTMWETWVTDDAKADILAALGL
jgi:glycine betaine/proline transport system substrate-binding protein